MREWLRKFPRRLSALIAAYAVILQPLFVVLSPPSLAHASIETGICSVLGGKAPAQPAAHDDSGCCIASGCAAGAGADLVSHLVMSSSRIAVAVTASAGSAASVAIWPNERPHSARAPPV